MSADDQQFLDLVSLPLYQFSACIWELSSDRYIAQLSSIPNEVRRYSTEVADVIEQHVDKIADQLRDTLSSQDWIPAAIRPRPKPTPAAVLAGPFSLYDRASNWVSRHKVLTGLIVLSTGVVVYRGYRNSRYYRKARRAKRARNGARLEVVVIAGSPNLPLTRSLSLDMERRGFIVYIICNTIDDEVMVQNLSRPDIRPLGIDITDVSFCPSQKATVDFVLISHAASRCRRLDRTLRTVFAVTACGRARSQDKLPHLEISHPYSISQLPDVAHSDHPTLKLRRPVQYPFTSPDSHHPGLLASSDSKTHVCWREIPAEGVGLHPFHHIRHQPSVPRA